MSVEEQDVPETEGVADLRQDLELNRNDSHVSHESQTAYE